MIADCNGKNMGGGGLDTSRDFLGNTKKIYEKRQSGCLVLWERFKQNADVR
jgi:hypothetical protein